MRTAIVMSPTRGGVFEVLRRHVRLGLGGSAGSGKQFVSWVHHADLVRAVRWLIDRDDISGPVNIAAPMPLPWNDVMRELRRASGVPVGLPTPAWMLEIGAVFLRTETELILKSRRVVPTRLLESGFTFLYPEWAAAVEDLCSVNARDAIGRAA